MLRSLMTQPGLGARTTYFPKKSYTGALPPGQPSLPPPAVGPGNRALGRGAVCARAWAQPAPSLSSSVRPSTRGTQLLTRHSRTNGLQARSSGRCPQDHHGCARSRPEQRTHTQDPTHGGRGAAAPRSARLRAPVLAAPSAPWRPLGSCAGGGGIHRPEVGGAGVSRATIQGLSPASRSAPGLR